ncbi:MAG: hypothetical protein HKM06_04370 [Spirochaetales bacterium]|nr:hypothetical protein [Spirochaetales bacterium]
MKRTFKGTIKAGLVAGAIVAMSFGAQSLFAADSGFEFHAYARSGFAFAPGLYLSGGQLDEHGIGRLGNELNQNYVESELVHSNTNSDGSWAKYHVMFVFNSNKGVNNANTGTSAFPSYPGSYGANGVGDVLMRQVYAEMGGFSWDPKATYWVGERYYGRDDIHILDYFWRDMSGEGVGITNGLNGLFDLAEVLFQGPTTTATSANYSEQFIPFTTDLRLHLGALTPALSGLEVEAAVTYADTANTASNGSGTSNYGIQAALVYSPDKFFWFADGYSRLVLQYGMGDSATEWSLGTANANIGADVNAYGIRAIVFGEASNVLPNLDIMPELTYAMFNNAGSQGNNASGAVVAQDVASHLSFVIRPVYKFTQNLSLQLEAGFDHIFATNQLTYYGAGGNVATGNAGVASAGFSATNYKVTLAPTLSLDSGFWGRPQLRLFWSLVGTSGAQNVYGWNGTANGTYTAGYVDANGTSTLENRFGVQFETWF